MGTPKEHLWPPFIAFGAVGVVLGAVVYAVTDGGTVAVLLLAVAAMVLNAGLVGAAVRGRE